MWYTMFYYVSPKGPNKGAATADARIWLDDGGGIDAFSGVDAAHAGVSI